MKVEVGKFYKTRSGETVEIIRTYVDDLTHKIRFVYTLDQKIFHSVLENGRLYYDGRYIDDYDLVEEVETPNEIKQAEIIKRIVKESYQESPDLIVRGLPISNKIDLSTELPEDTQYLELNKTVTVGDYTYDVVITITNRRERAYCEQGK